MSSVERVHIFPLICKIFNSFDEVYKLIINCKWVGRDYFVMTISSRANPQLFVNSSPTELTSPLKPFYIVGLQIYWYFFVFDWYTANTY